VKPIRTEVKISKKDKKIDEELKLISIFLMVGGLLVATIGTAYIIYDAVSHIVGS
jgi:hypothetical protein